ncbi:hypothetical protein ACX9NE_26790 [Mycobacterium sp. ML4]|nr:hypothetical protein [Mycobacteriaceae bacterium]
MADPFLTVDAFKAEYQGTLTAGETTTATRLLQVASDRIRALKPDADTDAAKQVVFEIVRDAANYGDLAVLSDFQNTTSRRTEAGTFDQAMKVVTDYLSDRHKKLLGIPLRAAPRGSFKRCDY